MMNGRAFLGPARDLIAHATEAHWRSAAGRAYYAAFQEARAALERWGVVVPARENIHAAVRLRNEADYQLASPGRFRFAKDASDAIVKATALINLFDAIESDPTRRAEVVAAIRP